MCWVGAGGPKEKPRQDPGGAVGENLNFLVKDKPTALGFVRGKRQKGEVVERVWPKTATQGKGLPECKKEKTFSPPILYGDTWGPTSKRF